MSEKTSCPDPVLHGFLSRHALVAPGERCQWQPLTGGVSSDIWRVDIDGRSLCVKRALAQLKVEADWSAPLSRNAYEWAWIQFAARHCPDNVPKPIAHDETAGLFAMEFLEPRHHPVWKQQLLSAQVDVATASAVGQVLGRLHAASSAQPQIAKAFDAIDNIYALRLEPYLVATAYKHPDLAPLLLELVARTAGTQRALVHGDVSPKNILVGPRGPVILDAECAWYGDPAFDIAFCLNHLLLKGIVVNEHAQLAASFEAFTSSYFEQVNWEPKSALETRAAQLLPGLTLARIDGKSPVEYITDEAMKNLVRTTSRALLTRRESKLSEVNRIWFEALRVISV